MKNKNSLDFFYNMAKDNPDEKAVKITKQSDFTKLDSAFILSFADKKTTILDLASGSGLIINKIYDRVAKIVAVEYFEQFSKYIIKASNVIVVNEDISKYTTKDKFDLITLFGVVQYFDEEETFNLYKKYINNLKHNGKIIVKNQFGVKEDVIISGYSNELKKDYFSHYRTLQKESDMLKKAGFNHLNIVDIYPPECSRWDNTHFYALVAER
ncbi:MAG: class I SAM-dependent methyltransferase [Bacteroidales bacterium]|jgi:cyclopropane fatty-acyl-phospholipid synthase-like methyltransferase|nr:class I SAM-dependent methyltransferase [Bacteroidales bacterium]MDD4214149.1 class I SAM-dependent methyltransferase [Bacteroidales bacterium]